MKMKLLLFSLLACGIIATVYSLDSADAPLNRSKRGITDFFRRFLGGRRKNPTYQQSLPYGTSSSLYGGSNQDYQDYLLSQASNQFNSIYGSQLANADYVFPGMTANGGGPNGGQFAYGHYGSPSGQNYGGNGQQHQAPYFSYANQHGQESGYQNQPAEQQSQHFQFRPQQQQHQHHHHHNQGFQPGYTSMYQHQANQQHGAGPSQQFQSEESTNQAVTYESAPQQPSQHVTADQDGVSYEPAGSQSQFAPHMMTLNSPAASYNRPQYAPYPVARPYSTNPGTIDVHQVLDQFIRSAGLSPQGTHDEVKGDHAYAESELKPVLSVKKLISYPFYFSSSGDKPTSYGQSIRRQSNDETIFNAALKQNLLASQKMDTPPEGKSTSAITYSQPAPATDEEAQFIAKHAQALQEFLSAKSLNTGNGLQPAAVSHYYTPTATAEATKDNKVTSTGSKA